MKKLFLFVLHLFCCYFVFGKQILYTGSTTAPVQVRIFLNIPLADSIDFIRWELKLDGNHYDLFCHYGISRPSTNGFMVDNKIAYRGSFAKTGHYLQLQKDKRSIYLLQVNDNLLHLLDDNKTLLAGNGGYSCVLNSKTPVLSRKFNYIAKTAALPAVMAFQGRTPCLEAVRIKDKPFYGVCEKMKWYVLLFSDAQGKPSYYLEGGRQYKKSTMSRGNWQLIKKDGRIIYKLENPMRAGPLYLLKANENVLFFTDDAGHLLTGNEDFSFTLNRTADREPAN